VDVDDAGRAAGFGFQDKDAGDGPALHQAQHFGRRGAGGHGHRAGGHEVGRWLTRNEVWNVRCLVVLTPRPVNS